MNLEIIRLEKTQISQAAETLMDAFRIEWENQEEVQEEEDFLLQILFQSTTVNDDEENYRSYWEAFLRYSQPLRHVYTTPEIKGVAAWIPPLGYPLDIWRCLEVGYYWGLVNSLSFFSDIYYIQNLKQPYWYLFALGVSKDYQRQGIGSALIQPILKRASCDGLPCHLLTHTEEGVKFYESNGFEVIKKFENPLKLEKTVTCWAMKKEP